MTPRILIVDDDENMCDELEEVLVGEGYTVRKAFDGLAGLALIDAHPCDLLLLDLRMPKLDGIAVLRKLKERPTRPRVLVMTARLVGSDLPRAEVNHGLAEAVGWDFVAGVLTKPFDIEEVLRRIREALPTAD